MTTPVADDVIAIRARLEELERERLEQLQRRIETPEGVNLGTWEAISDAMACGQGWVRMTIDGDEHVTLADVFRAPSVPTTWGTQARAEIDWMEVVRW